jgi:hypothetical protein
MKQNVNGAQRTMLRGQPLSFPVSPRELSPIANPERGFQSRGRKLQLPRAGSKPLTESTCRVSIKPLSSTRHPEWLGPRTERITRRTRGWSESGSEPRQVQWARVPPRHDQQPAQQGAASASRNPIQDCRAHPLQPAQPGQWSYARDQQGSGDAHQD